MEQRTAVRPISFILAFLMVAGMFFSVPFSVNAAVIPPGQNNKPETASHIEVNTSYSDNLVSSSDVNYYKFTSSADGYVRLKFTHTATTETKTYWYAYLYNSELTELTRISVKGTDALVESAYIGIPKGSYYIRVNDNYYSDAVYEICAVFQSANDWETEGNNEFGVADTIDWNKTYQGSLGKSGDVDCYQLTASTAGYVQLSFTHEAMADKSNYWEAILYDSNVTELTSFTVNGTSTEVTSALVGIPAGTYYVKVKSYSYYSNMKYGIKVAFTASSAWETELNDAIATADMIQCNATYSGTMRKSGDDDFYQFDTASDGYVQVRFSHSAMTETKNYWQTILYDSDMTELTSFTVNGTSTEVVSAFVGVPAGTYYIRVKTYSNYSKEKYDIQVDFAASSVWETELNDKVATADTIQLNTKYSGTLRNSSDVDYYSFSTEKDGYVQLQFSHEANAKTDTFWHARLLSDDIAELASIAIKGTGSEENSALIGIPKGTYYIEVTKGSYSNDVYNITAAFTVSDLWETEINDAVASADLISVNKEYSGTMRNNSDADFYQFTASSDGYVQVLFSHEAIAKSSTYWRVYLYDSDVSELASFTVAGTETETSTAKIGISAGTYYIKVQNSNYSDIKYRIKAAFTVAAEWETELNDKIATADKIKVNTAYKGNLRNSSDVDYYQLTTDNDGYIQLQFAHNPIAVNSIYWNIRLLNSDVTELTSMSVKGPDTDVKTARIGIPKGTYYIEIKDSYYNNADYTMTALFESSDSWETEINNDTATADQINVNKQYNGALGKSGDLDFYQFALSTAGYVQMHFTHEATASTSTYWKVYLYNNDVAELTSISISGTAAEVDSSLIGIPAGTYYVKVQSSSYSNAQYGLKLAFTASDVWETEVNDALANADSLAVGVQYYAALGKNGDVDYYQFTLDESIPLTIDFTHEPWVNSTTYWYVRLYNSDLQQLEVVKSTGATADVVIPEKQYDAGTYYIKVEKSSYSNEKYGIKITGKTDQHTLTFNGNGGAPVPDAITAEEGASVTIPKGEKNEPKKSFTLTFDANGGKADKTSAALACTFGGWSDGKTICQPGDSYVMGRTDKTLIAQWTNPKAGTLPDAKKDSMIFEGWYTEKGEKITPDTVIDQDTTVTAKWTPIPEPDKYTLTFDGNGGAPVPDAITAEEGTTVTIPKIIPETDKGYTITFHSNGGKVDQTSKLFTFTFKEWSDGKKTYQPDDSFTMGNADITLKAQWQNPIIKDGDLPYATREGYQFDGWYDDPEDGVLFMTDEAELTGDIDLYAYWYKVDTYAVSFDSNGGQPTPKSIEGKAYGDKITLPDAPKKQYTLTLEAGMGGKVAPASVTLDCQFGGWATSGETQIYPEKSEYTVIGTTTLKAKWKNPNAGALPDAEMDGMNFVGWFTKESGGTQIGPKTEITESATIYAHFIPKDKYTVKFNGNGGAPVPDAISAAEGDLVTIPEKTPEKAYTLSLDANGGAVDPAEITLKCSFTGWAHDSKFYQPKGTFVMGDKDVTLTAQWADPAAGTLPVPTHTDGNKEFTGWFTEKENGTEIKAETKITASGKIYAHWKDKEVPTPDGHVWGEGKIAVEPTCTKNGVMVYVCKDCGETKREAIPKIPHDLHHVSNPASCTNGGVEYDLCTMCEGIFNHVTTPKTEHIWDEGKVTKPATCLEDGETTFTCTVCKTTRTEPIKAPGAHAWDEGKVTRPATCVDDGVMTYTCTREGCGETKTEAIKASGEHAWDEGKVTKPATCKEEGVMTYTCTREGCGETKTEVIPVTDAHEFGDWDFSKLPNYHEEGEVKRICQICGKEETKPVAVLTPDATQTDAETGVEIGYMDTTYDGDVKLDVTNVFDGASFNVINKEKGDFQFKIVDITTTINGEKVQPNGTVLVRLPIPEGYNRDSLAVYYVNENGTIQKLAMWIEGDFACFEAEHFSHYALVDESENSGFMLGDVDGDGKVTSADARLALRASVKLEPAITEGTAAYKAADYNGDGVVKSEDARAILRVSVKLDPFG